MPAATSAFSGKGLLGSRPAPIYEINPASTGAGYLSKELINKMVDQKIRDKQLEQSDLTFRDIKIIKETLLDKLINIYHVRIEYPKEKEN